MNTQFHPVAMAVSKTIKKNGKNVREPVGTVEIFVPTLAEVIRFAAAAVQADGVDEKGKPTGKPAVDEEGLPVFTTDEANWILGAVASAVKMQCRNKLVAGSVALKDGQTIPTDWAGLVAEGVRSNGAALAALRDCVSDFAKYVGTLGKKESTAQTIVTLFKNNDALRLQSATMKGKMAEYVEAFATTLDETAVDRYERTLNKILEICQTEGDPTDDM